MHSTAIYNVQGKYYYSKMFLPSLDHIHGIHHGMHHRVCVNKLSLSA